MLFESKFSLHKTPTPTVVLKGLSNPGCNASQVYVEPLVSPLGYKVIELNVEYNFSPSRLTVVRDASEKRKKKLL